MNMKKADGTNRVVITGMGAVSPAGKGVQALWDKVMAGETAIGYITHFDSTDYPVHIAGEIPDYDPVAFGLTKREAKRIAPFVQYAYIAADEAMAQANFNMDEEDTTRIGTVFGSGIGGMEDIDKGSIAVNTRGPKKMNPLFIPTVISNMAAGNLSIRFGLRGACTNVVTACATGSHCIGEAYRMIKHGYLDAALAGGTEESVTSLSIAGFGNLGALTQRPDPKDASKPFDRDRSGFVAGEGAGAVVLESLEHAMARGANIIAEVTGYGSTGDAYHMTSPNPSGEGVARAMQMALDESGFTAEEVGHLNAHGTSTPLNDKTEAAALRIVVGEERGREIPVISVKGVTGHMLGGAGAVEAIVCALSVANDCVPPTAGYHNPDPEAPAHVLTEALTNYPQKVALSNSIGFGGHNATLAISPFHGE